MTPWPVRIARTKDGRTNLQQDCSDLRPGTYQKSIGGGEKGGGSKKNKNFCKQTFYKQNFYSQNFDSLNKQTIVKN